MSKGQERMSPNVAAILLNRLNELETVILKVGDLGEGWDVFDECKYLAMLITYDIDSNTLENNVTQE